MIMKFLDRALENKERDLFNLLDRSSISKTYASRQLKISKWDLMRLVSYINSKRKGNKIIIQGFTDVTQRGNVVYKEILAKAK